MEISVLPTAVGPTMTIKGIGERGEGSSDDIFKVYDFGTCAGFALDGDHIELPAFAAFRMHLEVVHGGRNR
jgi:hypothetical protein